MKRSFVIILGIFLFCLMLIGEENPYGNTTFKDLLPKLEYSYDEFEDFYWVTAKKQDKVDFFSDHLKYSDVQIYAGLTGKEKKEPDFFKFFVGFYDSDWLEFNRITFIANENRHIMNFNISERISDVNGKITYEAYDIILTDVNEDFLKDIFLSKEVKMRFYGEGKHKDKFLAPNELKKLKIMLQLNHLKNKQLQEEQKQQNDKKNPEEQKEDEKQVEQKQEMQKN